MIRLSWRKRIFWNGLLVLFMPIFLLAALLPSRLRRKLIWGSMPLISNRYWSAAMAAAGYDSLTIMQDHFAINRSDDFDRYFEDFAPRALPRSARRGLGTCLAFIYSLRTARVVHVSLMGFALENSWFWRLEAPFYHLAGIKLVAMPFGADFYRLSQVVDPSLRHVLLVDYPQMAIDEPRLTRRARYWVRHADAMVVGMQIDGIGRWDVPLNQFFHIDTNHWQSKSGWSDGDGVSRSVRILHTPNHRGFKGTEFLVAAVERLRGEGLQVELVQLEGVPNEEVRERMQQVDILAEQFIATGYAFNAIEGMASGLPVLANLDHEAYTRVFRRYGFLDECPVLSSPPERLADNLRLLVRNPALREELGRAGRAYVEKYHSYAAAQFLFGSIYRRFDGEEVDLINLFHPLKSEYNHATARIAHPLVDNRLPPGDPRWRC